jgi:hypothetical protein
VSKFGFDGLVVIVHAIGSTVFGSNPAEDNGFLREIKIRSTTSFGGKVKLCPLTKDVMAY